MQNLDRVVFDDYQAVQARLLNQRRRERKSIALRYEQLNDDAKAVVLSKYQYNLYIAPYKGLLDPELYQTNLLKDIQSIKVKSHCEGEFNGVYFKGQKELNTVMLLLGC